MWFWLIQAITGSILGNATSNWFQNTSAGKWFFKKTEQVYNWAADRYGFEVLKSEDKWRKKYPNIANQISELESRIKELHSRITSNPKEIMTTASVQHKEHTEAIQRLRDDLQNRVGVLEKWRWIIIGGSIVLGFLIQKLPIWS